MRAFQARIMIKKSTGKMPVPHSKGDTGFQPVHSTATATATTMNHNYGGGSGSCGKPSRDSTLRADARRTESSDRGPTS